MFQQDQGQQYEQETHPAGGTDSVTRFIKVVVAQTEDVWASEFNKMNREYQRPKLHLFTGYVQSACGTGASATGPFYCPGDQKIYLDRSFFKLLKNRFNAPGDFANAYVIAHEVGHHVQHLLGTAGKIEEMRAYADRKESNKLSVMLELQADFYAGIWAHHMRGRGDVMEDGDVEAALHAANAIGDDRLQQQTHGEVVPDAFTHGTSQQRMYWFKKGYETGDITQGNTFKEIGGASLH
jgi:predicted metalloprotease